VSGRIAGENRDGDLEDGGLRCGLGFRLAGVGGSDRANMHPHDGEGGAADAVGQENSEGQRCEAGTS